MGFIMLPLPSCSASLPSTLMHHFPSINKQQADTGPPNMSCMFKSSASWLIPLLLAIKLICTPGYIVQTTRYQILINRFTLLWCSY